MKSYSDLITTPTVLDPVISDLHLNTTADALGQRVTASVPLDTVLIDVMVDDPNPQHGDRDRQRGRQAVLAQRDRPRAGVRQQPEPGQGLGRAAAVGARRRRSVPSRHATSPSAWSWGCSSASASRCCATPSTPRSRASATSRRRPTRPSSAASPTTPTAPKHPLDRPVRPARPAGRGVPVPAHQPAVRRRGQPPPLDRLHLVAARRGQDHHGGQPRHQHGRGRRRVCVIEGDLRRPRLLRYMGLEGSVGLTNVLIGQAELADVLQPFGDTSLQVLGAGQIPPNPSELLGSETMARTDQPARGDVRLRHHRRARPCCPSPTPRC